MLFRSASNVLLQCLQFLIIVVICSPIFDLIKYRWNLNDLQDKVMGCGTARRGHLICNQAKQIGSNPIRSTKM